MTISDQTAYGPATATLLTLRRPDTTVFSSQEFDNAPAARHALDLIVGQANAELPEHAQLRRLGSGMSGKIVGPNDDVRLTYTLRPVGDPESNVLAFPGSVDAQVQSDVSLTDDLIREAATTGWKTRRVDGRYFTASVKRDGVTTTLGIRVLDGTISYSRSQTVEYAPTADTVRTWLREGR